uniref:Calcineurin subunit B type 1-like n=1 Tax=Saccoglossus kowalevskii TaxID=10224 RepID=A0ABM0GKY3_SACKO|nr:PREDICTED: calcineurin subunit B type 1-like [Saccoglossus kowalevskii]
MFRRKKGTLTNDQIKQLEARTVFNSGEIKKIQQKYSNYAEQGGNGISYMRLESLQQIPELVGYTLIPRVASTIADKQSGLLTAESFVELLSNMSPRKNVDQKRKFLFAVFDMYNEGSIKHDELFRMYKTMFNPALGDDQILNMVTKILDNTQTPGELSYEEFTELVPDHEIAEKLTVELQL